MSRDRLALWALGFRPFFLFGCAAGAITLAVWLFALTRTDPAVDLFWHAHEMIHGFAVAIVIGFLYTASQNWTGVRGVHGTRLMAVTTVWLAGRIAISWPDAHPQLVALIDLSFLPLAGGFLAPYLGRSGQRKNFVFLVLIALLWSGNLTYHLDRLGYWPGAARTALYLGAHVIVLMIVVIGGRVIPFFTERAIPGYVRRQVKRLDIASIVSMAAFVVAHAWNGMSLITGILALSAGILLLARLALWYDKRIWRNPILWILYMGYSWVAIGLVFSALATVSAVTQSVALHAFTAGAIGTMIAGMVSRVSLGHTGRPIRATGWIVVAYGLILIGGVLRVFGALIISQHYLGLMILAGSLWALGLAALAVVLAPILVAPRPDGRPG